MADAGHLSQAAVLRVALNRGMTSSARLAAGHLARDILLLRSWGIAVTISDDLRAHLAHTSASADLSATHDALIADPRRDLAWTIAGVLEEHRRVMTPPAVERVLLSRGWTTTAKSPSAVVVGALRVAARRYAPVEQSTAGYRWAESR